jgi:MoaA/NifB/PqqE/SkfB family radical SAM enzyme
MDIILEATRKCNMKCTHCVRGEPQNIDLEEEVIYRLSREDIGFLTLTGGEPTMNRDIISQFKSHGLYPYDIWLCTNGKYFEEEWMKEYLDYCNQLQYRDSGITGFSISADVYHKYELGQDEMNIRFAQYSKLAEIYGINISKHNKSQTDEKVRAEGRARYGIEVCDRHCEWDMNAKEYGDRVTYITVTGEVLYGGMWSYKRMNYLSLGNIKERSLSSILSSDKYIARYKRITSKEDCNIRQLKKYKKY